MVTTWRTFSCTRQGLGEGLKTRRNPPIPFLDRSQAPLRGSIAVALVASVWCSEFHRKIRPRNPNAVVTAHIDHHVGACWHVTIDALGSRRTLWVKMMCRRIVLHRMTLQTKT